LGYNAQIFNRIFEEQAKIISNKLENIDGLTEQIVQQNIYHKNDISAENGL